MAHPSHLSQLRMTRYSRDLGNRRSKSSTTSCLILIVEGPFKLGRIGAADATRDFHAMRGRRLLAIAFLGLPTENLAPELAPQVLDGDRQACNAARIPLAGGHTSDGLGPTFDPALVGVTDNEYLKRNDTKLSDCELFPTQPLGAEVPSIVRRHCKRAAAAMECEARPKQPPPYHHSAARCSPGTARRQGDENDPQVASLTNRQREVLRGPQTANGRPVAAEPKEEVHSPDGARAHCLALVRIGGLVPRVDVPGANAC